MISTERIFTMSSFEGLRTLRRCLIKFPSYSLDQLCSAITSTEADAKSLDLEASKRLHTLVDLDCSLDGEEFYRSCISAVVTRGQPIWGKSMMFGRLRFISSLDIDDQSIFDAAGLTREPVLEEIYQWWDQICSQSRAQKDADKMAQGRKAEALSIAHEKERLLNKGIDKRPIWVGLDDNFAGYDVHSYDLVDGIQKNVLIEVKSTIASPIRFYISRNEWKTAMEARSEFLFHIWDMSKVPEILYVRTVAQVEPNIPKDQCKGKWSTAILPLGN